MMKKKTIVLLLLLAVGWALVPAQRVDAQETPAAPRPPRQRPVPAQPTPAPTQPAPAPAQPARRPPRIPPTTQPAPATPQQPRTRTPAPAQPDPVPSPPAQPAPEAVPAPEFSAGRRAAAAALNPILGLGSYTMGDWVGGIVVTGLEGAAVGCVFWELSLDKDDDMYLAPGIAAIAAGGAAVLFGILRPIFYHRTPSAKKTAALMEGLDIGLVQAAGTAQAAGLKTTPGVRLSYRFQF